MTSEEYVQQIDRLMSLQNTYFTIFIAIIAIVIGFIGFLQFRISDKQIEKIQNETEENLLDQFNSKLEESVKNNKITLLNSTRYPLFQTIDLILMTDIRLSELPMKIEQILHSLEDIKELYEYEYDILKSTVIYFNKYKDEVMSMNERVFVNNYLSIEYIHNFITSRLTSNQKETEDYKMLKDEMEQFKFNYESRFNDYMKRKE